MEYDNDGYYRNNPYLRSDYMLSEDVKWKKNNKVITKGSTWKRRKYNAKTKEGTISVTNVDEHGDGVLSEHQDKHIITRTAIEENDIDIYKINPIESQNSTTLLNTMINNTFNSDLSLRSKYLQDIDMKVSYSKIEYETEGNYNNQPAIQSRGTYTTDEKGVSIDDGKLKTTYLKISPSMSNSHMQDLINTSENQIK